MSVGTDLARQVPLVLKPLREQVYELLKEELNQGRLAPGGYPGPARDRGAARDLPHAAARGAAAARLGGVRDHPGAPRVVVNPLTLDGIREIYQVVGTLESAAILAAGERLDAERVRAMRSANGRCGEALELDDFALYYEHNLAFHDTYLSLAGNGLLLRTVRVLKERLYDFPRRKGFVKEWELASTGEHAALVELLARSEIAAAAAYARDVHWSFAVQEPSSTATTSRAARRRRGRGG